MSVRRRPTVHLFAEVLEDRSTPATLTVTTTADSGTGSLRAAITQANADTTPDTIVFAPDLALRTIFLSTVGDTSIGPSALFVTGPVTVQGTGQSIALAGGVPAMRLFAVAPSGNLTLDGVTLFGGIAQGGAGAGLSGGGAGLGGAIYNQGTLQIYDSALIGNEAIGGSYQGGTTQGGGGGLSGPGNPDGSGGGPNGGPAGGGNGGPAGGGNGGFGGGGGAGTAGTSTTNGGTGGTGGFGGGGGQGGDGGTGTSAGTGGAGGFGGGGGGNTNEPEGGSITSGAGGFGGGAGLTGAFLLIAGGNSRGITGQGGGGAGMGGAIFNQGGTVIVANTTITGNTAVGGNRNSNGGGAAFGGGLFNLNGTATLTNVTLARNTVLGGNTTSQGGEVYNLSYDVGSVTSGQTATLILANDILADTFSNAAPQTVGGSDLVNNQVNGTATINATGPNLVSAAVVNTGGTLSGTAFTVADPNLGPLTGNGGQTQTMLPRAGSPALGAGSTAALTAANFGGTAPTTDQRGTGFPRTVNGKVDLGAAEVQPGGTVATAPSLVVSGVPTGPAEVFAQGSNGQYSSSPAATLTPFPGFAGEVRTAVGDVNGDGIPDTILVTGPGAPIQFAVISGADNTTVLVPPTSPFAGSEGFTGGGFVAAGDFAHIGRADIVITPDEGGGPRVAIFALLPTGLTQVANFFGINDPNFRGGARPAVGDVNRDGTPDLVVAAGFGGGPRVALYDGNTVLSGTPTELVNDFFAFPGTDATTLRNGVYVAIGDVDGDGFGDLIFGGGPGGAPRVFILPGRQLILGDPAFVYVLPVANFFVNGNSSDRGGVRVAAVNADGDDLADVAVGSGAGDPANVRVYLGKNFSGGGEPGTFQDLTVFGGTTLADGVYVG